MDEALKQIEILLADVLFYAEDNIPKPVLQSAPEILSNQNNRKFPDFFRLDQGNGFKYLIKGAKTARHSDKSL